MDKKKWEAIKQYIDDISPVSWGMLFWFGVTYVVTCFIKSSFEAYWLLLFLGLFIFNILSISYGYLWITKERKDKQRSVRERGLIRWILTFVLCIAFNIIYYYYTKWQVIAIYFTLSLIIVLFNYFCFPNKRKKK